MSDRLATSATISVLMMAAYVLLGTDAMRAPIGPADLASGPAVSAPGLLSNPGRISLID